MTAAKLISITGLWAEHTEDTDTNLQCHSGSCHLNLPSYVEVSRQGTVNTTNNNTDLDIFQRVMTLFNNGRIKTVWP